MKIQFQTDNPIDGTQTMAQWASSTGAPAVERFGDQIARVQVQVHMRDENAGKGNKDDSIHRVLEVRLDGHQPSVLKQHRLNLNRSVESAVEKIVRLVGTTRCKAARA